MLNFVVAILNFKYTGSLLVCGPGIEIMEIARSLLGAYSKLYENEGARRTLKALFTPPRLVFYPVLNHRSG